MGKKKKNLIWTVDQADRKFSEFIRGRDGKCMYPRCPRPSDISGLQCSHFWGRAIWALRFEPDNCDAAHAGCHYFHWEREKNGEYRDFKMAQLGKKRYAEMEQRYRDYKSGKVKTTKREEIKKLMEFLQYQEEES